MISDENGNEIIKNTENTAENGENITESTENITESTENITESTENITESTESITESTESITESTENISESTESITESTENISESTEIIPDNADTQEATVYQIEKQELSELLNTEGYSIPKKRNPLIYAVIGVILVSLAAFAVYASVQSPEKKLQRARSAASHDFNAFLENALFTKESNFTELTKKTQMDFSLTVKTIISSAGLPLFALNGGVLYGSVNTDEEEKRLDAFMNLNLQNEDLLNLHINLDNTVASFNIKELFDDDYYSVDAETMAEDYMNGSISALYVPPGDYTAMIMSVYEITDKINALNGTLSGSSAEELLNNKNVEALLKIDEKSQKVTKGGSVEIDGVKYDVYETSCGAETVRSVLLEYAEFFRTEYFKSMKDLEDIFPIADMNEYLGDAASESPYDSLIAYVSGIAFSGDVSAVCYVNGKKLERTVYTAKVTDEAGTYDITLCVAATGENNLYDALDISLEAVNASEKIELSISAHGNHADKSVFETDGIINFSYSNEKTGESKSHAIDLYISYDKAKNRTESEFGFSSSESPGKITAGAKWESVTDNAEKITRVVFDELYLSAPGEEITLGATLAFKPSETPPKEASELKLVEILKINEAEFAALSMRTYANYQLLLQRIMSLFGF